MGRLFREFAVTLEHRDCRLAVRLADYNSDDVRAVPEPASEQNMGRVLSRKRTCVRLEPGRLRAGLRWVLRHQPFMLALTARRSA